MTDSLLQIMQQNSTWALLIIFLIAFSESMAIIGLFVPGWVLLVGVGGLIGADLLSFYPVVLSAYLGAVIGESLSFYIGIRYKRQILAWPYFEKHQVLVKKSEDFFDKYGSAGVFIGRFIGPVRAFIPLVAGLSGMSRKRFFWVNMTSALIWAPFYLVPGILIGAAVQIDQQIAGNFLLALVVLALLIWFALAKTKLLWLSMKEESIKANKMPFINCLLSWSIVSVLLVYLFRSPYFDFMQQLLTILLDKMTG
ncbi:MAG: DedA family protein [Enterobacterales bacterium]|nr:DedA family protein [Enterobacterales bacterium]